MTTVNSSDSSEQWKWESLPKHYLESSHITAAKHLNANSNPSKRFVPFECIFEKFEKDLKHSIEIRTIRKGFEAFKCKFKPFERDSKCLNANSNHSTRIRSIRMQILTIRTGFETLECKFETFERDTKHSNANSNHSKGI